MNISNNDKFPHLYALYKLGGYTTPKGEEYSEIYSKELAVEYELIMNNIVARDKIGGNKKIHKI